MSLEARVDRLERVPKLFVVMGRRVRSEHEQKISIAIDAQIKDEEKLEASVSSLRFEMAELADSQAAIQRQPDHLYELLKGRE